MRSFDIEFPLEVDDEHWEPGDDREPFKQPEGTPSFVMAFNHFIKLTQIMAFALKTLVCGTNDLIINVSDLVYSMHLKNLLHIAEWFPWIVTPP